MSFCVRWSVTVSFSLVVRNGRERGPEYNNRYRYAKVKFVWEFGNSGVVLGNKCLPMRKLTAYGWDTLCDNSSKKIRWNAIFIRLSIVKDPLKIFTNWE